MKKRVISAIFILLILFTFLALRFVNISIFDIMTFGITLIAGYEISDCNKKSGKSNFLSAVLFLSVTLYASLTICFLTKSNVVTCVIAMVCDFALAIIFMVIVSLFAKGKAKEDETPVLKSYITTIKIMIYPVLLLSSLYFVNNMTIISPKINDVDIGLFLITSIFSVSMATDTFAFFVGKILKGPHLAPTISPKKTISGAIGGLVFGILALVALYAIFMQFDSYKLVFTELNINVYHIILIGALTSVFNQAGDLYESYEKRKLGIKDFGKIIPGHGGVMDRVDGMSFVSLVTFIIYAFILG